MIGLSIDKTKKFHIRPLLAKSDRISKVLHLSVVILLIAVIVIQIALQNDRIRKAITSVENSEGKLLRQSEQKH